LDARIASQLPRDWMSGWRGGQDALRRVETSPNKVVNCLLIRVLVDEVIQGFEDVQR
jgi:hypothetical protein